MAKQPQTSKQSVDSDTPLNYDTMRKLLVGIVMLLWLHPSNGENLIYNHVNFRYTPPVQRMMKELGLEGLTINIHRTSKPVRGFISLDGVGGFIVFVNSAEGNVLETIAHELVHIRQHVDGRWDINNPTVRVTKHGNMYVSPEARAIEMEANKLGRKLYYKCR
jgi:hypothetical protein